MSTAASLTPRHDRQVGLWLAACATVIFGMILLGGLNPVAAAAEAGIEVESHAMSTVLEYQSLIKFEELI